MILDCFNLKLFRYLEGLVNCEEFYKMLRKYIHDLYHGQLVHSTDFLALFFTTFAEVKVNMEDICNHWLNDPGICSTLSDQCEGNNDQNELLTEVQEILKSITDFDQKSRKRKKSTLPDISTLVSEQKVVMLEELLERPNLHKKTIEFLAKNIAYESNADVWHRWCEIVVANSYSPGFRSLKEFLEEHQAMGIYLYGEMLASKNAKLRRMAKTVANELRPEMDQNIVRNINEML